MSHPRCETQLRPSSRLSQLLPWGGQSGVAVWHATTQPQGACLADACSPEITMSSCRLVVQVIIMDAGSSFQRQALLSVCCTWLLR